MTQEERDEVIAKAKNLLAALGTNPGEVAAKLKEEGCRGSRKVAGDCPVYAYLKKHGIEHLVVCPWYVLVCRSTPATDGSSVATPYPVQQFIIGFDGGEYSELLHGAD